MSITVEELVEIPSLQTRFLAGRGGGERDVLWAHAVELADPWNWLERSHLLLTNGICVPHDVDGQVRFIEELDNKGIAGVVLGRGSILPEPTLEMLAVADERSFPVLEMAYEMPFNLLGQVVAERNMHRAHSRVGKILRAYEAFRKSQGAGQQEDALLADLSVECVIHVLHRDTGYDLIPPVEPIDAELRAAIVERTRSDRGPLPAFSRVEDRSFILPVEHTDAVMVATPRTPQSEVELMVLQHISTIAALEVDRRSTLQLRKRERGSRLLRDLIAGVSDTEVAIEQLADFRLDSPPWRVLVCTEGQEGSTGATQELLERAGVPHLLREQDREVLAVIPSGDLEELGKHLIAEDGVSVGASLPVQRLSRLGDATREARWALESALLPESPLSLYGEEVSPFLPRTLSEAEAVVQRLLGPVIEYDRMNDADLLESLTTYFDMNRSWQEAADKLGIHRQTLIYRISRIEKITGRRMQHLVDQTELFLAVQSWKALRQGVIG